MVGQTLGGWELLLIDNASTDEGPDVAKRWAIRDPRIQLLHEPRIGIAHALNTGLARAHGRSIARMDADDLGHPERLAKQVAYLDEHPEIGVLGTRTAFATSVPKSSGMRWFVGWQNAIIPPHAHYVKRFVDAPLAHPTAMFRREPVERAGAAIPVRSRSLRSMGVERTGGSLRKRSPLHQLNPNAWNCSTRSGDGSMGPR